MKLLPSKNTHYQIGQWATYRSRKLAAQAMEIPVRTLDVKIYRGEFGKHENQHKYRKHYKKMAEKKQDINNNKSQTISTMWKPRLSA